jgi:hypothetical protein
VKFKKFAQANFRKIVPTLQIISNLFLTQRTLPPIVTEWNQRISPLPAAPAVQSQAPSPHMRQLLDSSTWHQQQLIQLAAFLTHTPHTVVYFTAGINSFFIGILERIKNFTFPKSFI